MSKNQDILPEIGQILWKMFPKEAKTIVYKGMVYPTHDAMMVDWLDSSGVRIGPMGSDPTRHMAEKRIAALVRDLSKSPPFADDPFTHITVSVDDAGKLTLDVARIPEWDSWPRLYMRGVSEVTDDEARTLPIPPAILAECRAQRLAQPYQK